MKPARLAVIAVLASATFAQAQTPAPSADPAAGGSAAWDRPVGPADIVRPDGLPPLGKWMIDADMTPAHWLGEIYEGKHLREPINVVIVDRAAASPEEATRRLVAAATAAGYPLRWGHSSGYRGSIGGDLFEQVPEDKRHAFSNAPFELDNNHGRIFGPYRDTDRYLFIAAFSREDVDLLADPGHQFGSFDEARDDFAKNMDQKTGFRLSGFVPLQNALVDDPDVTTGDHDGMAALLEAQR